MSNLLKAEIRKMVAGLDEIIGEQAGKKVLRHLEEIRKLATRARRLGGDTSHPAKHTLLDRLEVTEAYQIAHAFSLHFQLVNLCEERARERHL